MEDAQFGVFLSKLTDLTGKSDGMVVSVKALAFNGIFRGRHLLVVFYGSHVLLMVHNQFSLHQMAVEGENKLKSVTSDCSESQIMLWHLDMPRFTLLPEEQETQQQQQSLVVTGERRR